MVFNLLGLGLDQLRNAVCLGNSSIFIDLRASLRRGGNSHDPIQGEQSDAATMGVGLEQPFMCLGVRVRTNHSFEAVVRCVTLQLTVPISPGAPESGCFNQACRRDSRHSGKLVAKTRSSAPIDLILTRPRSRYLLVPVSTSKTRAAGDFSLTLARHHQPRTWKRLFPLPQQAKRRLHACNTAGLTPQAVKAQLGCPGSGLTSDRSRGAHRAQTNCPFPAQRKGPANTV